jgi:Tol biopolymer transport system component/DNA-binding winged helix-turn-helix (wHTH) protein
VNCRTSRTTAKYFRKNSRIVVFSYARKGGIPAGSMQRFKFGLYELDARSGELHKNGRPIRLQAQPARVLLLLLNRPGELVTRDELRASIWGEGTFVDFDQGLNKAINKLREVLNDSPTNPRFIETIPKRGYRFVGEVIAEPGKGSAGATQPESIVQAGPEETATAVPTDLQTPARERSTTFNRLWAIAALVAVLLATWMLSAGGPSRLHVTGSRQLSNDGLQKRGLPQTDGRRVYFLVAKRGTSNFEIASVSTSGGDTVRIPTPLPRLDWLSDISPDGSQLLVVQQLGDRSGLRRAWLVPTSGGAARSVGDLRVHFAAFSPDGKRILYTLPEGIFTADLDGTDVRKLVSAGYALNARWWPDGSHVRFSQSGGVWDVRSDGTGLVRVAGLAAGNCGAWSRGARFFLYEQSGQLWGVPHHRKWLGTSPPTLLSFAAPHSLGLAVDPVNENIYTVVAHRRGEIVRYDRGKRVWTPYLSSLSAEYVDFSADGRWITYVAYPEGSLWRSRVDGTERLQLATESYVHTQLPRWSPDGTQIVFSAFKPPQQVRKMYLVSSAGGSVRELIPGTASSEATPSWSPDGKKIAFAPVPWEFGRPTSKVSVFDLTTKKVTDLPGNMSAFSPRWSPDGKYILARTVKPEATLMLHRLSDGAWRDLARGGGSAV